MILNYLNVIASLKLPRVGCGLIEVHFFLQGNMRTHQMHGLSHQLNGGGTLTLLLATCMRRLCTSAAARQATSIIAYAGRV